ncbi:FAD-dependent oxidoreductase, partial [Pseudonocardia sp.]|uniref:FAD-dependent oxidoreductase n=1 Tax=Pseudonocardia sp. TaxID=60912 RepID=UPI0031FC0983
LPGTLVVVGGGPVGCELGLLFATFGTIVTIVQRADRLLPREEPAVAETLTEKLHTLDVRTLPGTRSSKLGRVARRCARPSASDVRSTPIGCCRDITGVAPYTHTAEYQGRVVAANIRGEDTRSDYQAIPCTVYTHRSVVAVGHTEASARGAGIDPVAAQADIAETA